MLSLLTAESQLIDYPNIIIINILEVKNVAVFDSTSEEFELEGFEFKASNLRFEKHPFLYGHKALF